MVAPGRHNEASKKALVSQTFIPLPPPGVDRYCNEDGIAMDLPPNGCAILGLYIFSAVDGHGEPRSLDAAELAACNLYNELPRHVKHP